MFIEKEFPRYGKSDTLTNPGSTSGFVSPAEDYAKRRLHIGDRLITDPVNTFYFEASNNEMHFFGIFEGALLIVDRSIPVKSGMVIVCYVDDEWLVRKLLIKERTTYLCINSGLDASINITGKNIQIFGAVTWACNQIIK
jgi:DNA polymerase V